jgi:Icc-related predicted phosphoesterase
MRVFAVSDLHTDFKENWLLVNQISDVAYRNDVLIVAGDIADDIEVVKRTLAALRSKFVEVFYVPGNHELWVRTDACHSVEKLDRILDLAGRLGIHTKPATLGGIWIVPLLSWYDATFDENAAEDSEELEGWADFHFCKWPENIGPIHEYFLRRNEPFVRGYNRPVISFSHFLPRMDLLPSREALRFKDLPKVAGCRSLEEQIRRLSSIIHVFGHSHIDRDREIDGIRYVQNALSYPRDRKNPGFPMKMVWDSDAALKTDAPSGAG